MVRIVERRDIPGALFFEKNPHSRCSPKASLLKLSIANLNGFDMLSAVIFTTDI